MSPSSRRWLSAWLLAVGPACVACASLEVPPHIIDAGGGFPDFRPPAPDAPSAVGTFLPPGADGDGNEAMQPDPLEDTDALAPPQGADAAPGTAPPTGPPTSPPTQPPTAPPTEPPADDADFCVSETNRYRAQLGRPLVQRSAALEAFATEGAQEDHNAQSPHAHFQRTGGGGVAFAENACPGWLGWGVQGTVRATVANCLAAFFSEGPGGGHYENMLGAYGSVGCGWYIDAAQSITIVQDFGQ